MRIPRRDALLVGAASVASVGSLGASDSGLSAEPNAKLPRSKVERLGIGAIGMRYQGTVIADKARHHGDIVGISDVDRHVREQARASFGSTAKIFEDYQDMIARKDIDVVLIGAPDHWHAKMLVDAVRAGKDVYCEKPLTLTIDEGKLIRDVVQNSDQIVQVGTWQRNDFHFRMAVEMVLAGRIGKLQRVTCTTDANPTGGPFPIVSVPENLNWELWQGPAATKPFIAQRAHYHFRWWLDYAGGKMTDWGAHHIDIAQWAIDSYPVKIVGRGKMPTINNGYTVPTRFGADINFENGVELRIRDEGRRGILFEGQQGRIFVNRGILDGAPVKHLESQPLTRDDYVAYSDDNQERPERTGKLDAIINHMGNFFDCIETRREPISDVESQHRSATTCHLANLSIRLGRPLTWDPKAENFGNDVQANAMMNRPSRKGYEIL